MHFVRSGLAFREQLRIDRSIICGLQSAEIIGGFERVFIESIEA